METFAGQSPSAEFLARGKSFVINVFVGAHWGAEGLYPKLDEQTLKLNNPRSSVCE